MLRFFIVSIVAAAMADSSHDGACPEVKPMENCNETAYQGVWYEISKIPIKSQDKGQCVQAEYSLDGDVFKVKNSHVINGVQTLIEGIAKPVADANNVAKLVVFFKFGENLIENPYLILATDYTGYSISYSCKYDEKTKANKEQAWIMSRAKKLEGEAKTAVDTFLKDHPKVIDTAKLVQVDFSEEACKFTSTKTMTEQVAKP